MPLPIQPLERERPMLSLVWISRGWSVYLESDAMADEVTKAQCRLNSLESKPHYPLRALQGILGLMQGPIWIQLNRFRLGVYERLIDVPGQGEFLIKDLRTPDSLVGLRKLRDNLGLSLTKGSLSTPLLKLKGLSDSVSNMMPSLASRILVEAITFHEGYYGRFIILVHMGIGCTLRALSQAFAQEKPFMDIDIEMPISNKSILVGVSLGLAVAILFTFGISPCSGEIVSECITDSLYANSYWMGQAVYMEVPKQGPSQKWGGEGEVGILVLVLPRGKPLKGVLTGQQSVKRGALTQGVSTLMAKGKGDSRNDKKESY
ncbi:unnamed protein product [Sphenostylis stenocarpa]|uniref:Uncharacterized protein n=1 Tax=Sphenostylis stenocarpa TaxID=92480 RepID=A0AA86W3Y8_9FABA|nr:unnamed protein product [Sphenostylis stenocarpa]